MKVVKMRNTDDSRFANGDGIEPTEIEHKCEEIFDGTQLEAKYNYLVYHFRCDSGFFWARAYWDEIGSVSVFGPFDGRDYATMPERALDDALNGALDEAMLAYLKRRFAVIQRFGGEGYATVWPAE